MVILVYELRYRITEISRRRYSDAILLAGAFGLSKTVYCAGLFTSSLTLSGARLPSLQETNFQGLNSCISDRLRNIKRNGLLNFRRNKR